jgi:hypothetical protein
MAQKILDMTKYTLLLLLLGIGSGSNAATLELPMFTIETADGWTHSIIEPASTQNGSAQLSARTSLVSSTLVSITSASGIGDLKIHALAVPAGMEAVDEVSLRRLTNLDSRIDLEWQSWGNGSGYQFSYIENNSFHMQWWITNGQTILLASYSSDSGPSDSVIGEVDAMLDSINLL